MFKKFTYFFIASILAISSCSDYSNDPSASISLVPVKVKGDDDYSFLNIKTGKIVFQEEFQTEPSVVNEGVFYTRNKDGNYEYHLIEDLDSDEPEKSVIDIPGEFISGGLFSNGMAIVVEEGETIKAIDEKGETVFELNEPQHEGIVKVSTVCVNNRIKFADAAGRIGFLNNNGEVVIKAQFSAVQNFKNGVARAYRKKADGSNEYIIIDKNGAVETTIEEGIQFGERIGSSFLAMISEDRYGLVDDNNEVQVKFDKKIDDVSVLGENIRYQRNGKYGLMDNNGKVLIRHRYDELSKLDVDGNLLVAVKKDEHIILNTDGDEIFKDDGEAYGIGNGNYLVRDGKNISIRDKEGKELNEDDIRRMGKSIITYLITNRWQATTTIKSDYYNSAAILDLFKTINNSGTLNNFSVGQSITKVYPKYLKISQDNGDKTEGDKSTSEVSDDSYVYDGGQNSYATYWGFSFNQSDTEDATTEEDYTAEATAEELEYGDDAIGDVATADAEADTKPAFEFKDVAKDISLWSYNLSYEKNLNPSTELNLTLNFNDRIKKREYKQVTVTSSYGSYQKQEHVANVWNKDAKIKSISGRINIDSRNNKSEDIVKEIGKSLVSSKWKKKNKYSYKKGKLTLTLKERYKNNISFVLQ